MHTIKSVTYEYFTNQDIGDLLAPYGFKRGKYGDVAFRLCSSHFKEKQLAPTIYCRPNSIMCGDKDKCRKIRITIEELGE